MVGRRILGRRSPGVHRPTPEFKPPEFVRPPPVETTPPPAPPTATTRPSTPPKEEVSDFVREMEEEILQEMARECLRRPGTPVARRLQAAAATGAIPRALAQETRRTATEAPVASATETREASLTETENSDTSPEARQSREAEKELEDWLKSDAPQPQVDHINSLLEELLSGPTTRFLRTPLLRDRMLQDRPATPPQRADQQRRREPEEEERIMLRGPNGRRRRYNPYRQLQLSDYVSAHLSSDSSSDEPTAPVTRPTQQSVAPRRGDYKRTGVMFGGLTPIPTDTRIDPPPRVCLNCWKPGHARKACPAPARRDFCVNCGRRGVIIVTCPRCSEPHRRYIRENFGSPSRESGGSDEREAERRSLQENAPRPPAARPATRRSRWDLPSAPARQAPSPPSYAEAVAARPSAPTTSQRMAPTLASHTPTPTATLPTATIPPATSPVASPAVGRPPAAIIRAATPSTGPTRPPTAAPSVDPATVELERVRATVELAASIKHLPLDLQRQIFMGLFGDKGPQ